MMKQMARGSLDHASSKENPALWYGSRGTEAAITIEKLPFSCLGQLVSELCAHYMQPNSPCTGFHLSNYNGGVLIVSPSDVGE